MPRLAALAVSLTLAASPLPTDAQGLLSGDRIEGSVVAGGDIANSTVILGDVTGLTPEQVLDFMDRLELPDAAVRDEALRLIGLLLPENTRLEAGAVAGFFGILGEHQVPPEQLQVRLAEIAGGYLRLQDEIAAFRVADPEVQALRDRAAAELAAPTPDLEAARRDLAAARAMVRAKREAFARVLRTSSARRPRWSASRPYSRPRA